MCLNAIGTVYYALNDFQKGLDHFSRSLKYSADSSLNAGSYTYMAGIYFNLERYDSSKVFYEKAQAIYEKLGSYSDVIMCQLNIAGIYSRTGQFTKAITIAENALSVSLRTNDPSQIGYAYFSLGYFNYENNAVRKAIDYYKKSLVEYKKANDLIYVSNCHYGLSDSYYYLGDSKNALEHYKQYISIRDSVLNIEQAKEITKKEVMFQVEKDQMADSLKQVEKDHATQILNDEKVKRQKLYAFAGILAFIFMSFLALILLKSNRNKQKANEVIAGQKKEVEVQKAIVEEKQKEIIDSIKYAKRIQSSQLPTENYIDRNLMRLNRNKKKSPEQE
jgi:tetratricopeptide (TPR) repeat protein